VIGGGINVHENAGERDHRQSGRVQGLGQTLAGILSGASVLW
jgi:hypothetical protein